MPHILKCVVITLFIIAGLNAQEKEKPEACKNYNCPPPPSDQTCTLTNSNSPKLEKQLGELKDCCPVYQCIGKNNKTVIYIGITEKRKASNVTGRSIQGESAAATAPVTEAPITTAPPTQATTTSTTTPSPGLVSRRNCLNVFCPAYALPSMQCTFEHHSETYFYDEFLPCCPTMQCRSSDGTVSRFSRMIGGVVPTSAADVLVSKGLTEDATRCPKISCGENPALLLNAVCTEIPAIGNLASHELVTMGSFSDCCPTIWHCAVTEGVIYNIHEIIEKSFWSYTIKTIKYNATDVSKHCGDAQCPRLPRENLGSCRIVISPLQALSAFVKENWVCCPVYKCTIGAGAQQTGFSEIIGPVPAEENCEGFVCAEEPVLPPATCVKTNDKTKVAEILGKIKECCPVWMCTLEDGSVSYYYMASRDGFQYREIQTIKTEGSSNASSFITFSVDDTVQIQKKHSISQRSLTTSATESPVTAPNGAVSTSSSNSEKVANFLLWKQKCTAGDVCPNLEGLVCTGEDWTERTKYAPQIEGCCPMVLCTDKKGLQRTHFVKHSGVIPTSEIVKATEKLDTNQCAKVSCGTEVGQPSQGCSESDRQPLLSQVNPLLECCRMIKCDRSNGSYSLELGIFGASFQYYEISLYDIIPESVSQQKPAEAHQSQQSDAKGQVKTGNNAPVPPPPTPSMQRPPQNIQPPQNPPVPPFQPPNLPNNNNMQTHPFPNNMHSPQQPQFPQWTQFFPWSGGDSNIASVLRGNIADVFNKVFGGSMKIPQHGFDPNSFFSTFPRINFGAFGFSPQMAQMLGPHYPMYQQFASNPDGSMTMQQSMGKK